MKLQLKKYLWGPINIDNSVDKTQNITLPQISDQLQIDRWLCHNWQCTLKIYIGLHDHQQETPQFRASYSSEDKLSLESTIKKLLQIKSEDT